MTKRRLDDNDFVNKLRQKQKEDPEMKHQAAQNTLALLMRAQHSTGVAAPANDPETLRQYLTSHNPAPKVAVCYKCPNATIYDRCSHCEHDLCLNCLQQCNSCQQLYCTTCSNINYSQSLEQVFCLSCTQAPHSVTN
ncbi:hypothetical protein BD408DRAFT_424115 [Parasitella parasitica]|nr:hypothetical protein BD408DRAFT_424115 [Parasitella parasitica]